MAISAGSPAFQGTLTDTDVRWDVIAGAVDDRTPGEQGLEVRKRNSYFQPKLYAIWYFIIIVWKFEYFFEY